jgi:NHL repeat
MRARVASRLLIRSILPAIFGAGLLVSSVPTSAVRAPAVITPLTQQVPVAAPTQADPTIVRSRYVLMAANVLPRPSGTDRQSDPPDAPIRLDLFDDVSVVAVFDRFDPNSQGVTWVGHVQGSEGSTVTLVYGEDGLVQGNVLMLEGTYTIQPAPDELRASNRQTPGVLHVIAQVDLSRQRPKARPVPVSIPAAGRASDAGVAAQLQADTGDFIDVLVVYTPRVVSAMAGGEAALRSRIELLVSQTNTSYANSGVTQRIRLSLSVQVPYTEATFDLTGFTDLENLRNGAPGLQGVATLRNNYSADLVSMITRNDDVFAACGNAHHMADPSPAFEAFAFSITDFWCTSTPQTFAEMLGINMGLRYDWFVDNGTTPYTYAHGHISYAGASANRFRTLMASHELCTSQSVACQPLLRWSNPNQTFNGTPLGIPAGTRANCATGASDANTCDADSRLVLNNTAPIVANFRQSPAGTPGPFPKIAPADQASVSTAAVTLSWESAPFAVSYEYCYDTTNNNACDTSWIPATGISAQATGVIPSTTYYWQVRALNAYGATEANGGVWWRFTRQPQLPSFFGKIAPIDGAVGQPVSVTLSWQTSTDAASYEYCYDTTNNSACDGSWTSASATSALVSGLTPATVYYWQVRAVNPTGSLQANNNVWWSFGTTATGPSYPVTTFAGFADGFINSTDGMGTTARFMGPTGVAVDQAGTVYVADAQTIRKITPAGAVTTFAGNAGETGSTDATGTSARFSSATNVAVDSAGMIYVADKFNHTIRKITPAGVVTTLAGLAGASGSTDATGSAARFNQPEGVAVDAAGTVYVADRENHTIRKVTPAGVVTTLAGLAASSGSANGTGSAARFFWPTGVAVNSAGTIYVADSANNTIRRITPAGEVTTLAGLAGATGFSDGVGNSARFSLLTGVAVDSAGMIFVADRNNNLIRHITPGGAVSTLAGQANVIASSADGFGPTARFLSPRGVAVDSSGTVYVADTLNRTIRRRGPAGLGPNLVANANFSAGAANWQLFATPDNTYLASAVANGVFEFTRVPPPPGTSNAATVFQNTGQALPAGTFLIAQFALGNSSAVRKRISVLVLDHDFSDLSVCTFWLPANLPLSAYAMMTSTTRAWTNASIYFYAASEGANGGAYRLDDVTLQVQAGGPPTTTICADPVAPISTNSFSSTTLLTNGDFSTGALSPWGVFGTITQQIVSGVFEFIRPTNDPPAGVVFQTTGQPMTANQILTATFQLGNSSAVRKRVTVILHDSDFSDLSACTFWLPPGQALSGYTYRTYTTKAWANAMISVYAATTDSLQWIRLDNVTLQRTPHAAAGGAQCVGPGG